MNKIYTQILFVIILILSLNYSYSSENKILLRVNNEIITTIDILNEIKFLSLMNKEFAKINKNKKIEIAKNSLIKEKIKFIEISRFVKNVNIENEILEKISRNYFSNFQIKNLKDLEILLKENNLYMSDVKQKIIIDTYWKRLIYDKFYNSIKINRNEIKKNIIKNDTQKNYLLSEIVFNLSEDEEFSKKLDLIKKKIEKNSFSEAAFNFSISETAKNGGRLGWIKENILNKKIRNEVNNVKVGQFTKPIIIPGGFLILKVEDVKEIKINIDLNKEIENIVEKQSNEQLNRLSNIYLEKLKKDINLNET